MGLSTFYITHRSVTLIIWAWQHIGTAKDIDQGMKLGTAHPMGPLELADFIGELTLPKENAGQFLCSFVQGWSHDASCAWMVDSYLCKEHSQPMSGLLCSSMPAG